MGEGGVRGSLVRSGLFSEAGVRFFRRLGRLALAVALLALLAYGVLWLLVRHREGQAEEAWAALDSPASRPEVRFSRTLTTATAVELEALLRPLGLSQLPLESEAAIHDRTPWTDQMGVLHRHLERELERPGLSGSPPEPAQLRFMEERSAELAAVRRVLLSELPPRWGVDWEDRERHQFIHVLAVKSLAEWLLSDALWAQLQGDPARGEQDLEAAWVLVEILLDRPEVNAQGAAVGTAREVTGTLRKLERPGGGWESRMQTARFRTGLMAAFTLEGMRYLTSAKITAGLPLFGRRVRRERMFWRTYGRLWSRYSVADASLRIAREVSLLENRGECAGDFRPETRRIATSSPWWTATGRLGLPDHGVPWASLVQLRQEMELTRKVLQLKAARTADGRWPEAPDGIEDSSCPGTRWGYTVAQDGSVRLFLEEGPVPPNRRGAVDLPVVFEAPGPLRPDIEMSGSR